MALPTARYIVLNHEGVWKINLDNRYYGPFATQAEAVDSATGTAREANAKGYPAAVLLMRDGKFDTLWEAAAQPIADQSNPSSE
jgi:hypothetical protein